MGIYVGIDDAEQMPGNQSKNGHITKPSETIDIRQEHLFGAGTLVHGCRVIIREGQIVSFRLLVVSLIRDQGKASASITGIHNRNLPVLTVVGLSGSGQGSRQDGSSTDRMWAGGCHLRGIDRVILGPSGYADAASNNWQHCQQQPDDRPVPGRGQILTLFNLVQFPEDLLQFSVVIKSEDYLSLSIRIPDKAYFNLKITIELFL